MNKPIQLIINIYLFVLSYRENVCVEREEQEEDTDGNSNHEIAVDGNNFQSFGVVNLNFESCAEKQNKHVCTSL